MRKSNLLIIIIFLIIILTNEVLILKNGEKLIGKIIKMDEDTMTVYTKEGEFIIDRDDILEFYKDEKAYQNRQRSNQLNGSNKNVNKMIFVKGANFYWE